MDYYDFVVSIDQSVRDKLLRMAEASAHNSGCDLYTWERKIRSLNDFDGSKARNIESVSPQNYIEYNSDAESSDDVSDGNSSSSTIGAIEDVPTFESSASMSHSMDIIAVACEGIIKSLVAAGL